jgi:hypothetical protein
MSASWYETGRLAHHRPILRGRAPHGRCAQGWHGHTSSGRELSGGRWCCCRPTQWHLVFTRTCRVARSSTRPGWRRSTVSLIFSRLPRCRRRRPRAGSAAGRRPASRPCPGPRSWRFPSGPGRCRWCSSSHGRVSRLAHFLYVGADLVVVPGMFEPCGLAPMTAIRYGRCRSCGRRRHVPSGRQPGHRTSAAPPAGIVVRLHGRASVSSWPEPCRTTREPGPGQDYLNIDDYIRHK